MRQRLERMAPTLLYCLGERLVARITTNNGVLPPTVVPPIIREFAGTVRTEFDLYLRFMEEQLEPAEGYILRLRDVYANFKDWHQLQYGGTGV
jgi:hypothetical protein